MYRERLEALWSWIGLAAIADLVIALYLHLGQFLKSFSKLNIANVFTASKFHVIPNRSADCRLSIKNQWEVIEATMCSVLVKQSFEQENTFQITMQWNSVDTWSIFFIFPISKSSSTIIEMCF